MDFSKIKAAEIVASIGGILLAIAVFVKAYEARPENPNANIDGLKGVVSIWDVHSILRILLLLAAIAPLILTYIIARDHQLSWPRGEMTAVVGLTAMTLVLYNGVIDRPGEPSGEIELEIGWYGAMLGSVLIAVGGAMRSGDSERARKPPGVL